MSGPYTALRAVLDDAVAGRIVPTAAVLVGDCDRVLFEHYAGATAETVYDLSSLSKPLATVASLLRLVAADAVRLDTRVAEIVPDFARGSTERNEITVRDLLCHRAGLPAHRRYFEALASEERRTGQRLVATAAGARRIQELASIEPLERRVGSAAVYSDVGFIVLGRVVEHVSSARMDRTFDEAVIVPLALRSTGFIDLEAPSPPELAARAAPCGVCDWRGCEVRGCVQDENAYAMGGIAGHAGVFSTARDVHRIVAAHVRAYRGERGLFEPKLVREVWRRDDRTAATTWTHGWDTPSATASSAGTRIGSPAVGHLGFTGTSAWIDLERGIHVVLLTNRLQAGADPAGIRALRPRVHDAAFAAVDETTGRAGERP